MIKNSQFRTQENSGWKHERSVGKRRAGLSYSKYLSSDQKGPGSELLSEPKSYPHQNPIPDSVQRLSETWLEKRARQLCRDDPKSDQTGVEGEAKERREGSAYNLTISDSYKTDG